LFSKRPLLGRSSLWRLGLKQRKEAERDAGMAAGPLKCGPSAMQRSERIEMKQTQRDVGRTKDLDDEIAHCDREIATLKRNPEKNGINHDVMLAEWQKNRQVFVDEKKKAAKLIAE
jgi:hypothetical protein